MIKNSFTIRVLVISFLCLALPLLIDSFIFFQSIYSDSIATAKKDLKAVANFRSYNLLEFQPVSQIFLKELSYFMDLGNALEEKLDVEKMNKQLSQAVHTGSDFQILILAIESSSFYKIIASSQRTLIDTYFISYHRLAEVLEKGETVFVRYHFDTELQRYVPYIFSAQVVKSEKSGKPIGIIMAAANIEARMNELVEKSKFQPDFSFAILNADGIVFAATDNKLVGNYFEAISPKTREEIFESGKLGPSGLANEPLYIIKKDPPFFDFIFNDQVQVGYITASPVGHISLMSYSSKEVFFGAALRHFLLLYSIYGLILIVGGGVTYWISLWISHPLRQLSERMKEVSVGKLDSRFKAEPLGFDINILGALYNKTLDNLLENMQQAEDERVKKERYQRELAIVRQVQNSLLPGETPVVKGAELAGGYLPANDVGGDHYGYLTKLTQKGEEAVIVNIIDSFERGISSCLYALSVRGLLRTYATVTDDVGKTITSSNNTFIQDTEEKNVSLALFSGMYHVDSKTFSYCCCGHVPCILKREGGEVVVLGQEQIAFGSDRSTVYTTQSIQLMPGDSVIFATQGLITSTNEKKEEFGENRLLRLCQESHWKTAQATVDGIILAVKNHVQSHPQKKEVIVVALKVEFEGKNE